MYVSHNSRMFQSYEKITTATEKDCKFISVLNTHNNLTIRVRKRTTTDARYIALLGIPQRHLTLVTDHLIPR